MPVARDRLECLQILKLLQCVNEKDAYQIEKLVTNGVQYLINYNEPTNGDTALITAAISNDEETTQLLLNLGALPDTKDFEGRTAAMRSAEYGHVQCLEVLAKAGADLKVVDSKGRSVLYYCISSTERHAKCMEIALEYNADVNSRANDGRTAFFTACETAKDNESLCMALLNKGADVNINQMTTGRTPLMAAAASGSDTLVRAIIRHGAEINATDKYDRTAAHEAAKNGHFEVLAVLSGNGANFDVYDSKGNNPIHFAAKAHGKCVKFLGLRGCNPKAKNNEGELAKTIAKDNGAKDVMKSLRVAEKAFGKVAKGTEPWAIALYDWVYDHKDELVESIKNQLGIESTSAVPVEEMFQTLSDLGAPIQEEVIKKLTDTHIKEENFDLDTFLTGKKYISKNYLMESFGEKKKKGKKGKGGRGKKKAKLPFEICTLPSEQLMRPQDGGPPIMYIPKEENVTDNDRFSADRPPCHPLEDDSVWYVSQPDKQYISMNDAAKHGDLDSIKSALLRGYNIDTRDKYYKTPLMVACHYGNLDVAKALVELGANVNAKDNFHWTPLHHAAHSGMIDIVELLIKNGATIDAVAMNGATPLFRAIESSRLNVVEFLIKHGAKVQMENRKGANPMDASYFWADPRVFMAVKTKFDTLAPKDDKKKGGKGSSAKAKPRGGSAKEAPAQLSEPIPPPSPLRTPRTERKASILRAASALARGVDEDEDISFSPRRPWIPQPTFQEEMLTKQLKRERLGWESDFEDLYKTPFQQNVHQRCILIGGDEEN